MQPRPCSCTPMCKMRTTNPIAIRATREKGITFGESSVYRRSERACSTVARRLTSYVVLAHDPAVRDVAADYWLHSEPYYRDVVSWLTANTAEDPEAVAVLRALIARPADVTTERHLEAHLGALLDERPQLLAEALRIVRSADEEVYIDYFLGPRHSGTAVPVQLEDLRRRAEEVPRRRADPGAEIHVVLPVMERQGTGRIRNLVASLLALRDQSVGPEHYRVSVVEFDDYPRWRHVIEPLADHYLHVQGDGRFNKSWAINVGVRENSGSARLLCLLDADIIVDRNFLERNRARFSDPGHDAHIPHTECLSLDVVASHEVIDSRCFAGESEAPLHVARGLLLRHAPGGCLWTRPDLFHRIGGLDERYSGWGGEDEDMLIRLAAAGRCAQFDDVMLHLSHTRPPMRRTDGEPLNAHIQAGTWCGAAGYGMLSGPQSVS
jgi:hypothetical protein